ncbi:DEAD/DEAH box helicase, partial [Fulvivirga sp.]|uniref:DEAD/DEAH box helicase n=1 Tax=Fulvivirga sp. TaxID=1931237 RepID=UPI0032EFE111
MAVGEEWFQSRKWKVFDFQRQAWEAYLTGNHGLVNAPTGSGKTYSLVVPALLDGTVNSNKGLQVIWITPIRALAKEIANATERAIEGLGLDWKVGVRTGDTSTKERNAMKKNPPEFLITTPESLHLMLAQKGYPNLFKNLRAIVCDEWHELIGSKRGVQMELALSRLKSVSDNLRIWGISATIGNMDQAVEALLGDEKSYKIIRADIEKAIEVESVFPDSVEELPWAGHLGVNLIDKVIP